MNLLKTLGLIVMGYIGFKQLVAGETFLGSVYLLGLIGASLNMAAILANGGKMPVLTKHIRIKKSLKFSSTHCVLNKKTRFKCLCDIYKINGATYSIGDFIIYLIMAICIFKILFILI